MKTSKSFIKKTTEFAQLIDDCGLSKKGAARLLNVRYDTIKNWYYGRTKTPETVMLQMQQYAKAAAIIFQPQKT